MAGERPTGSEGIRYSSKTIILGGEIVKINGEVALGFTRSPLRWRGNNPHGRLRLTSPAEYSLTVQSGGYRRKRDLDRQRGHILVNVFDLTPEEGLMTVGPYNITTQIIDILQENGFRRGFLVRAESSLPMEKEIVDDVLSVEVAEEFAARRRRQQAGAPTPQTA